jgi:two-component system cell cycle response regulator DivK
MAKKILVVEDNEKNLILMRDILEYQGYVVVLAQDGEEGIRLAREHRPHLILMDIQMPVMDGYDALKILRGDPGLQGMKVVAITGLAMSGDKELMLQAGFDDYLAKPFSIRQLSTMIKRHLGEEQE